jgi:hypothetical protein
LKNPSTRKRWQVRAALLSGCAALVLATIPRASAQELGALRGEVDETVILRDRRLSPADTANTARTATTADGIPAPAYEPVSTGALPEADTDAEDIDFATEIETRTDPTTVSAILAAEIPEPPERMLPATAVAAVQGGSAASSEDPYAAEGLRLGSFILRPTVELGLTYSADVTASGSGTPPVVTNTLSNTVLGDSSLRLQLDSDWSRHALGINAFGRLQRSVNGTGTLDPELGIDATARIDITDTTTLTGTAGYSYQLDDPQSAAYFIATDPALVPAVTGTNEPVTQTLNGSLTLRQEFGMLFGEAGLSAQRSVYGAADLSDGTSIPQGDLDNTVYDGRLRAGFELSPVFAPFVEVGYGIRRMDETPDTGGVDRDAKRYALRLGTGVDFGEKLNGELSAGYLREDIADSALENIAGLAVDASLTWSPRRETDLNFSLSSSTETGGDAGESGAILYAADMGITHRIRANLSAEAGVGVDFRDSRGGADETTFSGQAGLTYWFNRFAGLSTRVSHEQTVSSDPLESSRTTTAFVGLRLQR